MSSVDSDLMATSSGGGGSVFLTLISHGGDTSAGREGRVSAKRGRMAASAGGGGMSESGGSGGMAASDGELRMAASAGCGGM